MTRRRKREYFSNGMEILERSWSLAAKELHKII
jgi:hypothetical protein